MVVADLGGPNRWVAEPQRFSLSDSRTSLDGKKKKVFQQVKTKRALQKQKLQVSLDRADDVIDENDGLAGGGNFVRNLGWGRRISWARQKTTKTG